MPTAGTPYRFSDLFFAKLGLFRSKKVIERFGKILKNYFNVGNIAFVNSGTTANFIIYKVLKELRKREEQVEIILPAYTAPSLLLPIEAEGLKPVLVDIDPATFNLDVNKVKEKLNSKTLAVMPIHMFGLPCEVDSLLQLTKDTDVFVLEDGASALGSTVDEKQIGTRAPFGFYSLNRGKNVSTLAGGIITWKDSDLNGIFDKYISELTSLPAHSQVVMFIKLFALSLAVRPFTYTLLNPIVAKFKYTALHTHFDSFQYTKMQAALGINLWKR
ncbi:MAG: DegT/DnrJ/EryC1/StrS family aminotransferase, partial [Candidatus Marinimicrobia bacterium]|nr:DegT/DnrJ/EryC1/StrS family aminotransferase [Candidatus Neomarinimicrobiota bacterium]